jgi:hypothetical protein
MTIRRELQNALESWTADVSEAFAIAATVIASVIAVLRKRFPGMAFSELELLLADVQHEIENIYFDLVHNTVDRDAVVDIIATRFFGED